MKIKKPSSATIQDTATLLGGVVIGGAISKGAFGIIHEDKVLTDAAAIKKQENTKMMKRGALALATAAGATFIDGKDAVSVVVKGLLLGMATAQTLEIVKEASAKSDAVKEIASSTDPAKKFLARSLGLNCACDYNSEMLNGARRRHGKLRAPVYEPDFAIDQSSSNSLEAIVNAGKTAA